MQVFSRREKLRQQERDLSKALFCETNSCVTHPLLKGLNICVRLRESNLSQSNVFANSFCCLNGKPHFLEEFKLNDRKSGISVTHNVGEFVYTSSAVSLVFIHTGQAKNRMFKNITAEKTQMIISPPPTHTQYVVL